MSQAASPYTPEPAAPIAVYLDTVSANSTVDGWAAYRDRARPCHIQVWLDSEMLGEGLADRFRPDLLQAGIGHGHYAFAISIRPLPPDHYALRLVDGATGAELPYFGPNPVFAPAITPPPRPRVEQLLLQPARWRDADVLDYPACLDLAGNLAALGTDRFVDRLFRFALGRWADPGGAAHYAARLNDGSMTPSDLLRAVLQSDERKAQKRPLPNPFAGDFPLQPALPRDAALG